MCGIAFTINNSGTYSYKLEKFFQDALIVSQLRGMDSTGLFQVDSKYNTYMYKQAMCASNFVDMKHAKSFLSDVGKSRVTVGHVRAATQGKVTNDNAHPFEAQRLDKKGYILGVHNGSLTGWGNKKGASDFAVDSEWAINHIANEGADAFEDIHGPYCFVWYDNSKDNQGKLHVARNSQRPMHFTLSKDKKQAFFMSEAEMLAMVIERNTIATVDDIYSLEPDMLYVFDLTTPEVTWSKSKLPVKSTASEHFSQSRYSGEYDDNAYNLQYDYETNTYGYRPAEKPKEKETTLSSAGRSVIDSWKLAMSEEPKLLTRDKDDDSKMLQDDENNYKAPRTWYSTQTATHAEQQTALQSGSFGEVVFMTGVAYEPSTQEYFGEIEEFDHVTKEKIKYDAVVRMLTAKKASYEYGAGGWGVVVGEYVDNTTTMKCLIVSPFTKRGEEKFLAMAS